MRSSEVGPLLEGEGGDTDPEVGELALLERLDLLGVGAEAGGIVEVTERSLFGTAPAQPVGRRTEARKVRA
jgi:hypothetical protein